MNSSTLFRQLASLFVAAPLAACRCIRSSVTCRCRSDACLSVQWSTVVRSSSSRWSPRNRSVQLPASWLPIRFGPAGVAGPPQPLHFLSGLQYCVEFPGHPRWFRFHFIQLILCYIQTMCSLAKRLLDAPEPVQFLRRELAAGGRITSSHICAYNEETSHVLLQR